MPVNPDFSDLFSALNDAEARYLMVGGYAVSLRAHLIRNKQACGRPQDLIDAARLARDP